MSPRLAARSGAGRRPSAAQAAPNLLIHELKHLASRLQLLNENLSLHFDDPGFRQSAWELLDDTVRQLRRLAGEMHEREGRLMVKLRVDLNEILDDALASCHPDLAGTVELEERTSPLPPVWGDRFLLRRAFSCAIENALEAMAGRGTLLVASGIVRRGGRPRILVEVIDDGPGMSPEFQRRLLARQFASSKADGLGLGVYTVRQVVALHGGTVRIASAPGTGTAVRFFFPLDED
jgi:signal transduction histidine kinase